MAAPSAESARSLKEPLTSPKSPSSQAGKQPPVQISQLMPIKSAIKIPFSPRIQIAETIRAPCLQVDWGGGISISFVFVVLCPYFSYIWFSVLIPLWKQGLILSALVRRDWSGTKQFTHTHTHTHTHPHTHAEQWRFEDRRIARQDVRAEAVLEGESYFALVLAPRVYPAGLCWEELGLCPLSPDVCLSQGWSLGHMYILWRGVFYGWDIYRSHAHSDPSSCYHHMTQVRPEARAFVETKRWCQRRNFEVMVTQLRLYVSREMLLLRVELQKFPKWKRLNCEKILVLSGWDNGSADRTTRMRSHLFTRVVAMDTQLNIVV